jgi:thiamine pyrophosphokinase
MKAIIFANGDFPPPNKLLDINDKDLVIAADGGSRHCSALDLIPDILIGDLDSTDPKVVENWRNLGVKIIKYPEDKDQTDLELALLIAQENEIEEIVIYGALGGRLDMTLGNLILLAHPKLGLPIKLIHGMEEIQLLRSGESLTINGNPGDTISLIPLEAGTSRVTTDGLQYALKGELLEFGYTRGISNSLAADQAKIKLESGLLAVVQIRE